MVPAPFRRQSRRSLSFAGCAGRAPRFSEAAPLFMRGSTLFPGTGERESPFGATPGASSVGIGWRIDFNESAWV